MLKRLVHLRIEIQQQPKLLQLLRQLPKELLEYQLLQPKLLSKPLLLLLLEVLPNAGPSS